MFSQAVLNSTATSSMRGPIYHLSSTSNWTKKRKRDPLRLSVSVNWPPNSFACALTFHRTTGTAEEPTYPLSLPETVELVRWAGRVLSENDPATNGPIATASEAGFALQFNSWELENMLTDPDRPLEQISSPKLTCQSNNIQQDIQAGNSIVFERSNGTTGIGQTFGISFDAEFTQHIALAGSSAVGTLVNRA